MHTAFTDMKYVGTSLNIACRSYVKKAGALIYTAGYPVSLGHLKLTPNPGEHTHVYIKCQDFIYLRK